MKRVLVVFVMSLILMGAYAFAEEAIYHDLGCTPEDVLQALYLEDDEYVSYYYRFYNNGDNLNDYGGLIDLGLSATLPWCPGTMYQDGICFDYALLTDVRSRNVNVFIFTYEIPEGSSDAMSIETGLGCWNRVIEACSEDVQESYKNARTAFEAGLSGGYGSDYMREYYAERCTFSCMADGKRIFYGVTSETDFNWTEYEVDDQLLAEFAEKFQEQSEFADEAEIRLWPNEQYTVFLAPVSRVGYTNPDNQLSVSIWLYGNEIDAIGFTQTTMQDYYFPVQYPDGIEPFEYRYKNMRISGLCAEAEEQIDVFQAAILAWEKVFSNE